MSEQFVGAAASRDADANSNLVSKFPWRVSALLAHLASAFRLLGTSEMRSSVSVSASARR
jgi:hypothetical protein